MTVQVTEAINERRLETKGGQLRGDRVWFVYGLTTAIPNARDLFDADIVGTDSGLPSKGDGYPGESSIKASDYSITQVPDSNTLIAGEVSKVWRIAWTYEAFVPGGGGGEPPGFIDWSTSIRAEFVDAWRAYDAEILNGITALTASNPPSTDIGGTKIDAAGTPVSFALTSMVWRVEQHLELPTNETIKAIINQSVFLAGKRNSSPFLFSDPPDTGQVLYLGAELNRVGETRYIRQHEFVVDEFFHLRQQVLRDIEGRPYVPFLPPDIEGPPVPPEQTFAETVYWVQPFKDTGEFGILGIGV